MFGKYRKASKRSKFGPKSTTLAAYSGVFLLVMTMVAIGYQSPQQVDSVANVAASSAQTAEAQPSVDEIVAANVAAGIALQANLPVAGNIAEQSVSLRIQGQLSQQANVSSIAKPQIVQPSEGNRTIKQYTTIDGDTVSSVATQFGVSTDTIKWANNLTGDTLNVGKSLKILPVDGILYTAKAGDTLENIAQRYKTSAEAITVYNDLELSGLADGKELIVPSGVLPTEDRPGYVAPVARSYSGYGNSYALPASFNMGNVGNRYAFGNCTWYAYQHRALIGKPIGSFWGNANMWDDSARASGYTVNNTPAVGAIAQWEAYAGAGVTYAGHVGVVQSVNADGTVTIVEMNYYGNGGGFNRISQRTISAGEPSSYIH